MDGLGLEKGRPVESDGSFLVTTPEYYSVAALMEHDQRYFHPQNKNYIRRYLIKKPLGYALLLGSSHYSSPEPPLRCVERDLQVMAEVLREGGWDVEAPYDGRTEAADYEQAMQKLTTTDMNKYSCFMFYYTGHGSPEGMLLEPNGDLVYFEKVVEAVRSLNDFRGKPKIIIFDCCRASGADCSVGSFLMSLGEAFASKYKDMVVCYSCTKYAPSVSAYENGSIFTQNFAKKLQQLGRKLSFVDLLSQVTGETGCEVRERYKMDQHPVSHLGLSAQLLLKETVLSSDHDRELAKRTQFPIVLVPLDCQPERKGPIDAGHDGPLRNPPPPQTTPSRVAMETSQLPSSQVAMETSQLPSSQVAMETSQLPSSQIVMESSQLPSSQVVMESSQHESVMRDHVTTRSKFTSKRDVVLNIRTLGQGHHVFLCYLPDPFSPYDPPNPERVQRNLNCVSLLHYDLTQHGFVVTSDLSIRDQRPLNPIKWYVHHIECCNHVILVCSPAFKELFSSSSTRRVADQKASHFLSYSSAIYAERDKCLESGVVKFYPVVLEPEWLDYEESVPLLLRSGDIYQLCEQQPRVFDYEDNERHFEQLVCAMVGINRAKMNAPQPGAPMTFTSTSTVAEANRRKYLAHARRPRVGYVTVPFDVGQPTSERSAREQAWANVPLTAQTSPSSSLSSSSYQTAPSAMTSYDVMESYGAQSGSLEEATCSSTSSLSSSANLPSTADTAPPHSERQYVAMHYAPSHSPRPPPAHHIVLPVTSDPSPAPTCGGPHSNPNLLSLPLTPPPTPLLLWLSNEVVHWKFLARYLDIDENTIERITREHQNDIREQCFKMLTTFVQQQGKAATCWKLGEALLQSEKNKQLFGKFCAELSELSTK